MSSKREVPVDPVFVDSITTDSNPEGINQYTGGSSIHGKGTFTGRASLKAKALTEKAEKEPTRANITRAARAHLEAAKLHINLGSKVQAQKHSNNFARLMKKLD